MLKPSEWKKSCRWGAIELKTVPSLPPSNAVMPIDVMTSATVPGSGSSATAPTTGGRA